MKKTPLLIAAAVLLSVAALHAQDFTLKAAPEVPGAIGWVDVDKDRNGNTAVEIKIRNLAPAARLTPPKDDYIVWVRERGKDAVRIGKLALDEHLDSQINFITLARQFELLITAEDGPTVESPSGLVVLSGDVHTKN